MNENQDKAVGAPEETENAQIIRLLTQIRDLEAWKAGVYYGPQGELLEIPKEPKASVFTSLL